MSKSRETSAGQTAEEKGPSVAENDGGGIAGGNTAGGNIAGGIIGNDASRPWHQSWPAHLPHSLSYPDVCIPWILERNLEVFGERTAIRFLSHETLADDSLEAESLEEVSLKEIESLTYAQLTAQVRALAAGLQGLGVAKGDRVGLCLPNSPHLIASFYAVWRAGAVAVPCNPLLSAGELTHQLEDAGAKLLIGGGEGAGAAASQLGIPLVLSGTDGAPRNPTPRDSTTQPPNARPPNAQSPKLLQPAARLEDMLSGDGAGLRPVAMEPAEDLALLLYTGGTTGSPKGAQLTHRNIVVNTIQFSEWYAFEPGGETCISVIPMFHSGGMAGVMNVPLYAGATLLVMSRFNPATVAKAVEKYRATRLFGVPTMFIALLNNERARGCDFSSLRACRTNAAPLPASVKADFDALVGHEVLVEGYGLTETSPLTHANPIDGARAGSIGLPICDTDAKIVDLKEGHDLCPGESGEIVIRGPQVMRGYWKNAQETGAAMKNGWFHTGDVGLMDEQGYFTVVDRLKDVINTAGYKVWPREVEEVIYNHPAVKLVAVVGAADDYRGEIVKAFVVPKEGQAHKLKPEDIIALCKENLAPYKAPRIVEFRDQLPVSGVGKMLRRVLREEQAK